MKFVWKCLVQSTVAVCVSTSLSTFVSAQDAAPEGVVRISRPSSRTVSSSELTPVSAVMADGSCNAGGSMQGCPVNPTPDFGGAMNGSAVGGMNGCPCQNGGMGGGMGGCPPMGRGHGAGLHARGGCPPWGHRYSHSEYDPYGHPMLEYLKCKFGYFIPTGGGGQGVPWVGHYGRVYPVDPYYRDGRDGQAYAAQGYGLPMSVPLAPVVGHTYEYGWGTPSSRLTPVSNPAY